MKNVRAALLVFSALVAAGALFLIIWANWPPSVTIRTTTLHLIAPADWGEPAVNQIGAQTFTLTLTYPETIKTGQTGRYQMDLERLPATVLVGGEKYQLRARCELILPGFINQQEGMLTQSVQDLKPVRFTWDLHALEPQSAEGTLRFYVDYVSPSNTVISQLISIIELQLTSESLSGLSTTGATSLAVALVLLTGLAGGLGLTRPRFS